MNRRMMFLVLGALAGLTACAGASTTPEPRPDDPGPIEPGWERGPVYVDSAEVLRKESHPVQATLLVLGSLPTPCHRIAWDVAGPTKEGRIEVSLYSLTNPELACIQVLESFEQSIPLGSFTEGEFEIVLNGDVIGDIQI